ncbi:MAG: TrkH family potassium uptake protein [Nitratireductor sp.]|nr:TrkH family potassium uptake protein [Nitratireductor sp.]MCB1455434.1 TrkH family potassium uptake protein [Nitratireductor sp.]MCB1458864.1 TrkH family potassium uptake protein [Nitratireductor sp.]
MFSDSYRTVAYVNGLFCLYLALGMLPAMAVDIIDGNDDWRGFLSALFLVGSLSGAVILANRGQFQPFSLRIGFLLVTTLWLSTSLVSSLPFLFGARDISFTDAAFEAVSGLTTTGATVLSGLDDMPRGLLLWRSTTQWLGGIGIVAMGLLVFPFLRIGGMQFFRMESSERSDKPVARIQTFAVSLIGLYCLLTLVCMVLYAVGGMTWFDALNHAMTTISTAGFSTRDSSFAQFGDLILVTAIIFMLIGAMPFTAFFLLVLNNDYKRAMDSQIAALLLIILVLMVPAFASASSHGSLSATDALIHSLFNVVSIVTTTGYATTDYTQWGTLSAGVFLVAMFVGGCAGSTAGGFKTYRLIILFQTLRVSVRELVYPNGVFPVYYNNKRISPEALQSVTTFFTAYIAILFLFTLLLAATGLDLVTAFTGTLATLSNVGPALGDIIGPAGHFGPLSDTAKWLLIMLMFLGRLEIMTVLVIASPVFWRGN